MHEIENAVQSEFDILLSVCTTQCLQKCPLKLLIIVIASCVIAYLIFYVCLILYLNKIEIEYESLCNLVIMNTHDLEKLVHFPTSEKNTLNLIITPLPGQFLDIQSPDRLGDHQSTYSPIKKPQRKVYR